jgi:hypothetical protein
MVITSREAKDRSVPNVVKLFYGRNIPIREVSERVLLWQIISQYLNLSM